MTQTEQRDKSALDAICFEGPEPWEIPTVIALVLLTILWLVRTYTRNKKLREQGAELCRKSLEK